MSILRSALVAAIMAAPFVTAAARADDLAGTVAAKLRDSGTLSGYRVNVKAKAGTVWLEGRVADQKQLQTAVSVAENTPGVERVVNRLSIGGQPDAASPSSGLGLPKSVWGVVGMPAPASKAERPAATPAGTDAQPGPRALLTLGGKEPGPVQLTQALTPSNRPQAGAKSADPRPAAQSSRSNQPRPLGAPLARSMQPVPGAGRQAGQPPRTANRGAIQRTSMRTVQDGGMHLPVPDGYDGPVAGGVPLADGQMVPGSMRVIDNGAGDYDGGGYAANCPPGAGGYGGGMAGGGMGGPMPMGGTGVGQPPIPGRGNGPNVPNYAWPSYSAYPNYAAVQYPTQYSPTAWPYIGPFYPYPQVPLGWRRVSLEWDDGWWFLDFDERHIHSHHR